MSCSSSSNIRSQLIAQTINVTASGSRIAFNIDTSGNGYTIGSGITAGSVIRYDPATLSYVRSNASEADTAEVIGVVEKYFSSNGATVFTVVANGLMNYPSLSSVPDLYTPGSACVPSVSGAENLGGKDIFFLSDGCSGSLQLIEPNTPGSIVKPVIQAINVPDYNAIVLNYIGYEVGEQAQAEYPVDGLLGSVTYVYSGSSVPYGYLNVTNQVEVSVDEYPDLYSLIQTNYGHYQETLTMVNVSGINPCTQCAVQNSGGVQYNIGDVVNVDSVNNKITVKRSYDQPKTNTALKITVNGFDKDIINTTTVKFTVPRLDSQTITFKSDQVNRTVELIPLMKVKNDLSFVSVVQKLSLTGLTMDGRDVVATLDHLCAANGSCP